MSSGRGKPRPAPSGPRPRGAQHRTGTSASSLAGGAGQPARAGGGVLAFLRTAVIVSLLTFAIWYGAESQTLSTESVELTVRPELPAEIAWRVDSEVQQDWTGQVTLQLRGPAGEVARARERLGRGQPIPVMPRTLPPSGPLVLDLRRDLRIAGVINEAMVTVESVQPSTLSLRIDRLLTVPLRVEPRFPLQRLAGLPTVVPSVVEAQLPASVVERLGEDPIATVHVTDEMLEDLDPGQESPLSALPIRLDAEVLGSWRPELPRVSVRVTVAERRAEEVVSLRLQVMLPSELSAEWFCEIGPSDFDRTVRLVGPARQVEQLLRGQARPLAVLRLSREELEQGAGEKPFSVIGLPSSVEFRTEQPLVRYRATRRSVSGGFYGPPRPDAGEG